METTWRSPDEQPSASWQTIFKTSAGLGMKVMDVAQCDEPTIGSAKEIDNDEYRIPNRRQRRKH